MNGKPCAHCGSSEGVTVWDRDLEKYVHVDVCHWPMASCGRTFTHRPHGGPTATRDASCDGQVR